MIYESLLVPTERPTSLLEIKKALLTYDKVYLANPNDRDLMPGTALAYAQFGLNAFTFDMGDVRPIGKVIGHDDIFEKIHEQCKPAINQGLVETVSTFDVNSTKGVEHIGGVPTGGYPLNLRDVYTLYRSMAENDDFLSCAIASDRATIISNIDTSPDFVKEGKADFRLNDGPILPSLDPNIFGQNYAKPLTLVARARIASLIKYAGFCHLKNIIPVFNTSVYGGIICALINNTNTLINSLEDDTYWLRRNRVLQLCHQEFMNDELINSKTIPQILKMRTKLWGKCAQSREKLFESAGDIALNASTDEDFEDKANFLIAKYKNEIIELSSQRKSISFKIKCDIAKAALALPSVVYPVLTQLQAPTAMASTLALGGIFAFKKLEEYKPVLDHFQKLDETHKRGAGIGLNNFYSKISID